MTNESRLLLIAGPSGVGKTEIIKTLERLDGSIGYVRPLMTRPNRKNELNKISVSRQEILSYEKTGRLLALNEVYGTLYGTPREPIERMLRQCQTPVLDWPLNRIALPKLVLKGRVFVAYVEPPSIEVLRRRLQDGRDPTGQRFRSAVVELSALWHGESQHDVDFRVVNQDGSIAQAATAIYEAYCFAVDPRMRVSP